mgnify:FL=1
MLDGRGAKDHFFEIQETMHTYFSNIGEINARRQKYAAYKPATLAPSVVHAPE